MRYLVLIAILLGGCYAKGELERDCDALVARDSGHARDFITPDFPSRYWEEQCQRILDPVAMLVEECVEDWGDRISYFKAFEEDLRCREVIALRDIDEFDRCIVRLLQMTCQEFRMGWVPEECRGQLILRNE